MFGRKLRALTQSVEEALSYEPRLKTLENEKAKRDEQARTEAFKAAGCIDIDAAQTLCDMDREARERWYLQGCFRGKPVPGSIEWCKSKHPALFKPEPTPVRKVAR